MDSAHGSGDYQHRSSNVCLNGAEEDQRAVASDPCSQEPPGPLLRGRRAPAPVPGPGPRPHRPRLPRGAAGWAEPFAFPRSAAGTRGFPPIIVHPRVRPNCFQHSSGDGHRGSLLSPFVLCFRNEPLTICKKSELLC